MQNAIDFSKETRWEKLFSHGVELDRDQSLIGEFSRYLREHKNDFVKLYHGTDKTHPVMTKGLLPTSNSRKNSLQSRNGFVSVSVFEGHARKFGEMAYPGKEIEVYSVTSTIGNLVADIDQLRNLRLWGDNENLKNSLSHSLIFGHGAQIKGGIEPFFIQPLSLIKPVEKEIIDLSGYIKIAADDVSKLRRQDVFRVIESVMDLPGGEGIADQLVNFISTNRPDLASEAKEVFDEVSGMSQMSIGM